VSLGPDGVQSNGDSDRQVVSADGRFVAFLSTASNLVPGDTNGEPDVFVHDRRTGSTRRVSVGTGGAQGNSVSDNPAISADGRFVAFASYASNLVRGDGNDDQDVFVRDRQAGTTARVSLGPGGAQGDFYSDNPALSANGRFVAFESGASNLVPGDSNGVLDVFVRDRQTGTTRRVSLGAAGAQGDEFSFGPAISADGRFVAFASVATNLVPGDTNGEADVFVRDRKAGTTRRVSFGLGSAQGNGESYAPALSADGRLVAFLSRATNLVPGDTNGVQDVFVRSLAP
jgi:Tol biopolymer transport system component